MCGIFGIASDKIIDFKVIKSLAADAQRRGNDASGLMYFDNDKYKVKRANFDILKLLNNNTKFQSKFIIGHSRLITNGLADNQPVQYNDVLVIHNGIIVNSDELWKSLGESPRLEIDTEIIAALVSKGLEKQFTLKDISKSLLNKVKGAFSCAIVIPKQGKLILVSNNGSLYYSVKDRDVSFSSEKRSLNKIGLHKVRQLKNDFIEFSLEISDFDILNNHENKDQINYITEYSKNRQFEEKLVFNEPALKRCTKCILPETMPFIDFDIDGVCNYCRNYAPRNQPKPVEDFEKLLDKYKRPTGSDCIVPFSGGRDSCYGLHLMVKRLKLKPITYTYDWGMVTDLGRRNISRMTSQLGVENIVIAADISKKRYNIKKNLSAWLNNPTLGMVSILTAGDKHFFKYINDVKRETGIDLNLWSINPLEVTHFKSGFLGIPPDFAEEKVYSSKWSQQLRYQSLRFREMVKNTSYFNSSLWDTLTGEYYRSFTTKSHYYHVFDYWRWDEAEIDKTLTTEYDWELATDTTTTWRIGDGTAAFYNYIYYTAAGFTEHDTFRSNQIREGDITRHEALERVAIENRPRYENIKWYLDSVGLDFLDVIEKINTMSKEYF